ncbi:hypothetical protein L1I30_03260 [Gillisia sp. M10.2A]|uniref:Uncharacterized protein n=1 Tax=Gillisia lutea TaxID=2909668 RepID=A0ABS9ECS0_9FLAO|nr:hypothetical protein [Gillisia lutea]MCF4100677.1 hypothetical protein [Gillisia lutea]
MKNLLLVCSAVLAVIMFSSCAGNKDLQERSPAQFGEAYFDVQGNITTFYLPVNAIQTERIRLDSIYFRNMMAPLEKDPSTPGLYIAKLTSGKRDFIMSSDPTEEYANKMPIKSDLPDFKIQDNEAILLFSQNGKSKYFKLKGIKERSQE